MTKNLSRQLSELSGIEARYICSAKTEQEMQCMICRDFNSKPEIPCYGCRMSIENYPNFEAPENFVKLLEVLINSPAYIRLGKTYNEVGCGRGLTFLDAVIDFLKTIEEAQNEESDEILKQLKQALQATEWVYL